MKIKRIKIKGDATLENLLEIYADNKSLLKSDLDIKWQMNEKQIKQYIEILTGPMINSYMLRIAKGQLDEVDGLYFRGRKIIVKE